MRENPILRKEFLSAVKSPVINLLLWIYLLSLAGLLLLLWPGGGVQSAVSEKSREIYSLFYSVNLTLVILLAPAFTATAITYERENNTFAALFTTLLSPFDIIFGKLTAAVALLLTAVIISTPVSSLCALTGGVSLIFVLKTMSLVFAAAISYGLTGLAFGSLCSRSSTAIIVNYVIIMVLAGATWLPSALLSGFGYEAVWQIVRSFSPYDALFYLLYPETYGLTTNVQMSGMFVSPYLVFMLFSVFISCAGLVIFWRAALKPASGKSGGAAGTYTDFSTGIKRRLSWPFYLFDPLKRKKPTGRFSNPVFKAEMRSKLFANPRFVIRGVSAIFIVSMLILTLITFQFGMSLRADTVRFCAIVFQIGVVAMLAPAVSSGLITDEITGRTFVALRMTPIHPVTVVSGKLKATFFYALIFIVSGLFVLVAMAYLEQQEVFPEGSVTSLSWWTQTLGRMKSSDWWTKFWETYKSLFVWVCILLLATLTFLTAGLFSSSVSKTTAAATAVSYGFAAFICVVSFAPLVLGERLSPGLSFFILSFNPVAAAMQTTSDAFSSYPGLWKANILFLGVLSALFLTGATVRTWILFNRQE